ncbi:hypothetical protein DMP23_09510 [Amycolatopsis sp. A1MSW2902]|uniref:thiopeptide maturation pyridine synthase n=1 Tax=Amycolatopsis sp. A1MSW2902 TaxID=687413 RepID=UPI00307D3DF1
MWHALRVSCRGDQDDLIVNGLRPLFDRIRPVVRGTHFLRHWRQGPHIRCHFRCEPGRFAEVVLPAAEVLVLPYLRRMPETTGFDEEATLDAHRVLAREEQVTGPLLPWIPDRTMRVVPYEDRAPVIGEAEARMVERFHERTNDLALDQLRWIIRGDSRARIAFDLLVASAHALNPGAIGRGSVSLRSHSESFLTYSGGGSELRAGWAREYASQADRLRRRMCDVVESIDERTGAFPHVDSWLEVMLPLRDVAGRLVAAGTLTLDAAHAAGSVREGYTEPSGTGFYHDWMMAHRSGRARVESSGWFLTYRWVLNCTYLHLSRIGLPARSRYRLCAYVANAVEEHFGLDTRSIAETLIGEPARTRIRTERRF